jgi:hypothetical protein
VVVFTPNPQRSTAKRCSVRYGTTQPDLASSSSTFTTDRPSPTQPRICSSRAASASQAAPCPFGRTGRTASTTAAISSSVSASTPASRTRPAAWAACT